MRLLCQLLVAEVAEIKLKNFDKVFIFNSSLRYLLISKLAGIKNISQYPLFRKKDKETPIILMGYLNNFISHIDLIQKSDKDGVDAILVVDVPGELKLNDYGIDNPNINVISLISPTTKDNRVSKIAQNS